jgi:hypothetical protein
VISAERNAGVLLLARRFGYRFTALLGGVAAGARATLTVPSDGAPTRWHLKAFERGQVTFCGEG